MAFNPFSGMTEARLLEIRTELQEALASTVMSVTSGGVSSQNLTQSGDILRRLEWVNGALYSVNPETYPLTTTNQRDTRCGPNFTIAAL